MERGDFCTVFTVYTGFLPVPLARLGFDPRPRGNRKPHMRDWREHGKPVNTVERYRWGMLTNRQLQILRMFCSGMTYREVARALGLSPETINPSLKQSAKRLGAPGIARETLREYARELL